GLNDALFLGGSWGRGVTNATFGSANHSTGFGLYGSSGTRHGSIAFAPLLETVYSTSGIAAGTNPTRPAIAPTGQQLTTTYGASAVFEHGWNAEWRTSIFGGAEKIDYNATANAILCSNYRAGSAAGALSNFNTTCNMDYTIYGAGTRTTWTPVR